jgi:hypothetical protein
MITLSASAASSSSCEYRRLISQLANKTSPLALACAIEFADFCVQRIIARDFDAPHDVGNDRALIGSEKLPRSLLIDAELDRFEQVTSLVSG